MQLANTDLLAQEINTLESFCTAHHISLFYGEVNDHSAPQAVWQNSTAGQLDAYTSVVQKAAPTLLTVTIERYQQERDEPMLELIRHHKAGLWGASLQAYDEAQDVLKHRDGQIITYTLSFFHQSVCYIFERDANWRTHFDTLTDAYELRRGEGVGDAFEDEALSEEEQTLVDAIIRNPLYQKAKPYLPRLRVVQELLKKEGVTDEDRIHLIAAEAQERFTQEMEPQLAADRRREVQALKEQGCTKAEVKGRLSLTETQLNRCWY